ncbi:hypothetical protein [Sulfobacillus thermosulfidooxidans]|uniref:hypothetical protein n=1 Tax=Sulfobacillus thermosulfidooxidans TaxID=28034 RepID=UPI0002DA0415|nr:hypothetical protein [Sulfobacillus thermosulfidooxidans]
MGPFIQELVLKGNARLYEKDVFIPIASNYPIPNTETIILEAPTNFVWIVYEIDLVPADVNNYLVVTGPNIGSNVTLRAQHGPIETAFLVTDTAAWTATITNNTSSGLAVAVRYIELTTLAYTLLVDPSYRGETAAWKKVLTTANRQPSHIHQEAK